MVLAYSAYLLVLHCLEVTLILLSNIIFRATAFLLFLFLFRGHLVVVIPNEKDRETVSAALPSAKIVCITTPGQVNTRVP